MISGLRANEYCLNNDVIVRNTLNWVHFKAKKLWEQQDIEASDSEKPMFPNTYGKWMYFFQDPDFAFNLCMEAIERGVVDEAKYTDKPKGVCCFCVDGNDFFAHERVIQFFLNHNLIRRTRAEKLYDISFKYDYQSWNSECGENFHAEIKLSDFIDLETEEWKA